MSLWFAIMFTALVITAIALLYLIRRMCQFQFLRKYEQTAPKKQKIWASVIVFAVFGLTGCILNLVNAIVCALYFAMIWAVCDFIFWIIQKVRHRPFQKYYAGIFGIVLAILALACGWYLNHTVFKTEYNLTTQKQVPDLTIAMFADSHVGTTFDAKGFARHLQTIQAQNPDIVIIAGDYVDDATSKQDLIESSKALGQLKTKYGVYFAPGNHDRGYYGRMYRGYSGQDVLDELTKNGVHILRDETVLLDDAYYIIGRKDYSQEKENRGTRKSMHELVEPLDPNKYMIVIDHQPADYENQAKANVDLVLSGHTHGGQLFPFNRVGQWIGANDKIYGHEKRQNTDFIVTSGISNWTMKFKTGTKSEYTIIKVKTD